MVSLLLLLLSSSMLFAFFFLLFLLFRCYCTFRHRLFLYYFHIIYPFSVALRACSFFYLYFFLLIPSDSHICLQLSHSSIFRSPYRTFTASILNLIFDSSPLFFPLSTINPRVPHLPFHVTHFAATLLHHRFLLHSRGNCFFSSVSFAFCLSFFVCIVHVCEYDVSILMWKCEISC